MWEVAEMWHSPSSSHGGAAVHAADSAAAQAAPVTGAEAAATVAEAEVEQPACKKQCTPVKPVAVKPLAVATVCHPSAILAPQQPASPSLNLPAKRRLEETVTAAAPAVTAAAATTPALSVTATDSLSMPKSTRQTALSPQCHQPASCYQVAAPTFYPLCRSCGFNRVNQSYHAECFACHKHSIGRPSHQLRGKWRTMW